MVDVHTPEQRSRNMAAIKSKNTKPEMIVRRLVHGMGFRYGLHRDDLPGKPDIVLTRHRKVILVHGCYWHMHSCRFGLVKPRTNARFWESKRMSNVERDKRSLKALRKEGWRAIVIWECQTRNISRLQLRLGHFLKITK